MTSDFYVDGGQEKEDNFGDIPKERIHFKLIIL